MNRLDAAFAKAVTVPSVPINNDEFAKARQRFMASKAFRQWLFEALLIVDEQYDSDFSSADFTEVIDTMLRSGLGD